MLSKAGAAFSRKKMSTVDTAWLRMDSDGNLMMIVGVAMLDRPISTEGLKHALATRFLVHSRFRSRVETDLTGAWWQEQEVNLDDHVVHTALPVVKKHESNKPALQALVGKLSRQKLDPSKPLWQMHLVDHCIGEDGKQRQALIIRIHHCIADGVALVGVFMSMFSTSPHEEQPAEAIHRQADAGEDNPWEQIMLPITATSIKAIDMSSAMFIKSLSMLTDFGKLGHELTDFGHAAGHAAQVAAQMASDAVQIATMSEDSHTRLKGKPSGKKHVAWCEPLPLDEVKAIGKAFGCSINDVLMSSVAGALRAYLCAKGDVVADDCEVRVMVPVNLRKASRQQKLGNAFGLVPLVLPVGMEDPLLRLAEVRKRMNDLKGSYTALVAMSMLGVLGATPKQVQNEIQNYFARRATAVMSNVPGPQKPLYIGGSQLDQIMFWVPQSGDIGIGISILSYNGGVQFGIVTDDAMVRDPDHIIARFAPEFEKLVLLAMMSDWG